MSTYWLYLSKKDVASIEMYQQDPFTNEEVKVIVANTLVLNDVVDYTLSKLLKEENKKGSQVIVNTRL